MAKLSAETIAELKAQHGTVLRQVITEHGDVVFKPPTRQAWDKYQDARLDKTGEPSAVARELAEHCLCKPLYTRDHLVAIIDKLPAVLQGEMMNAIVDMAGGIEDYETVKL